MNRVRNVMRVTVLALVLASCGHGKPAISNDASTALQAKVAQLRASASAHDAPAVAAELEALRAQVAELRRTDQLSATAAQTVLDAATAVDRTLPLITTTTTTPRPVPGRGHDKGEGNDGGD